MPRFNIGNAPRCTGHKRNGDPCHGVARKGKTKCRLCGGNSLSGIASPQFKTGRFSKYLPLSLTDGYQAALADPNLHSIADEIALTQVRLDQLVQRLATSDLGNAWLDVDASWKTFTAARTSGDVAAMGDALAQHEQALRAGKTQYHLWADIIDKVKVSADLRLKEHKRLLDLGAMMSIDRANVVFGILLQATRSAVLEHADRETARHILTAIQAAVGSLDTRRLAEPSLP